MSADIFICKECRFETCNVKKFTNHLRKHKLSVKDYYDKYLKKPGDGVCKLCGAATRFKNCRDGYLCYCSHKCLNSAPETQAKIRSTCLKKYGYEHYSTSPAYIEKCIKSNREKYGADWVTQTLDFKHQVKETSLAKYGVENPGQSVNARIKRKITCNKKFGADSYLESEHFNQHKYKFKNGHSSYRYDELTFDSSWELAFYIYLKHKKIEFIYHPNIVFTYNENGIEKHYHPDFIVNDKLIEIKGDMFYDMQYKFHMSPEKIACIHEHAIVMTADDMKEIFNYLLKHLNLSASKLKRIYKCN